MSSSVLSITLEEGEIMSVFTSIQGVRKTCIGVIFLSLIVLLSCQKLLSNLNTSHFRYWHIVDDKRFLC